MRTGTGTAPSPHRRPAMTSLFRRSSSNGGSRGGSSAQELNNSRPARQVRRLEFNQAMEDFKTMFPNMDYDIIECVLRANNGAVDATIDQLLQMNLDGSGCDDSSDSEDSIPPEVTCLEVPSLGSGFHSVATSVSSCLLLPGHGAAQLLQAGRGLSAWISCTKNCHGQCFRLKASALPSLPHPKTQQRPFCCCQRDSLGLCAPKERLTHPRPLKAVPPNSTKTPVGAGGPVPAGFPTLSAAAFILCHPCFAAARGALARWGELPSPHPLTLQILERTLEPDSSDEEPPPVYSPPAYESQALGSRYPRAPPTPPPR